MSVYYNPYSYIYFNENIFLFQEQQLIAQKWYIVYKKYFFKQPT
jgi:hypothetical protein